MNLIFLHGAPAVGKLTISNELAKIINTRLLDNHASIDLARTILNFEDVGFWKLVHELRLLVLEAAVVHNLPSVIMTSCYSEPEDKVKFEQFERIVRRSHGEVYPVYLFCGQEEILRRVGNPDRVERKKIITATDLEIFTSKCNFTYIPRDNCLKLDTGIKTACDSAREIIEHFALM